MPAFGILTWLLYRKARPFYVAHLYYAIHFHAFVFVALTVMLLLALAGDGYGQPAARVVPLVITAYHFVGVRRVFGGSWFQTAWKGTLVWIVYVFLVMTTMILVGLPSMRATGVGVSVK